MQCIFSMPDLIIMTVDHCDALNRAEKVQEIQGWLKNHPVSSSSRASCDLQILDTGIVEKIEEELEKTKVMITHKPQQSQ